MENASGWRWSSETKVSRVLYSFWKEARIVMKTLLGLLRWCVLLVLCWPLALLALVLWPLVWLLSLPFRLVGITFGALFAFLGAVLMLPARLLGGGPRQAGATR